MTMNTVGLHRTTPPPPRGVAFVRADASDPTQILASLNRAFEAFKAENDARLKALEKDREDVVTNDKLDRINAEIGRLQGELSEAVQRAAALQTAPGAGRAIPDSAYSNSFLAHMRRGSVEASLNKGAASEGGYLAPMEWDRTILDRLVRISPMRAICQTIKISTAGFSKLFNNRGTTSGWVGEQAARPATATPTLGQLTYATGELYAKPEATQQMLDDSVIDLEQWLAGEVETEFAYQEGVAFLSGDGTNKPTGLLTYVTGAANAAAHPWGDVKTVVSGAAAALTSDGVINLIYALPSEYTMDARFVMNRNTQAALRKLKDGQGNYLWQPSAIAGQPATLNGYPITEMAGMPDIAAGAKPILFGDFRRGYLIVDRMGVRVLRDPFSNKPFVQFYTTKRVGGGLLDPDVIKAQTVSV